ncbi:tape measure protein [Anaerococcus sp. Marseille-Q5996]|uniref:tape measure protein n=1 Tax=Anaerococcus sp. Marseille-Q5996 TaxID=2972769 RepID=UPI0021C8083C|nr:tape measure protein [Anaerococcus sp. Marseille-Q5996]
MAVIKSTVVLDDKYSSKAEKIASSTNAMSEAMKKSQSVASKMTSALKSAFSRSHKVKISEVGSKETRAKIYKLNNDLKSITGKPLNFEISAKTGKIEHIKNQFSKMKSGVNSLSGAFNNKLDKGFGKLTKFTSDISSFHKAKKEARSLSKELTKMTGQKHKIKIDMENPIKKGFANLKSGIGNMFSKMNPKNWFGRSSAPMMAPQMGGGSMLGSFIKGNLISSAITSGIGMLKSGVDTTLGAGMTRLENIQSAKARLRGQTNADGTRKFNDSQIKAISDSAMNAVTGTAYGFGDAMSTASSAIAAGVDQKNIEPYLKNIANISAATGSDFNEIGALINKIQTTGRLQGDELMQLSDRGLPMLAKIAELKGVDANTARDMISKGEISAEDAIKAATAAAGDSAKEMNKTWNAAKMNFGSALSKIGAGLLGGKEGEEGGIFGAMTPMLLKVNDALNGFVPIAKNAGDAIKDFATNGFEKLKSGFGKVSEFFKPAMDKFKEGFSKVSEKVGEFIDPLKEKFVTVFDGLKEAFAPLVEGISNLFGDGIEGNMDIFTTVIDLVGQGLTMLAEAIITATPIIQSVVEWISANIIPVISELVAWVSGTLIPAIAEVESTVMGVLLPIFQTVADFIGTYVVPAFQIIADTVLTVAEPVFHAIASAVEWATGKFNDLVGAVGAAANALFELPGKIAGMVGDAVGGAVGSVKSFLGIGKNATGTSYFGGGMTQINERGEEMIQLARGDKIYPAGKTEKIIKNDIKKNSNNTTTTQVHAPVNMYIYTNDEKKIVQTMDAYFKKLGVLV